MIALNLRGHGLHGSQLDAFEAQLTTSHKMRVNIDIRDAHEKVITRLSNPNILTGSVQVDATQAVSRSLSVTLLDPGMKITFDSTNPADLAVFADNFISVTYGVFVDALNDWVDVPVFWGPISAFERTGPEVSIEAQGKESLALDPVFIINGYHLPHGVSVVKAIKDVMRRVGEERFQIDGLKGHLRTHRTIAPNTQPWQHVVGGGQDQNGHPVPGLMSKSSGNHYAFYDGAGYLRVKVKPGHSVWKFTEDMVLGHPGIKYDISNFRNHIVVKGGTPKHSKKHYKGTATLPAGNPLSPHNLGRNGHPRYLTTFFESSSLKSDAKCRAKARELLAAAGKEGVDATFDCLPIPHLEPYDQITLKMDGYSVAMPLTTYTLPLTHDTPMSVGFTRPVKVAHKRKRHHH